MDPSLPVGRIKLLRERRGLPQAVVAGLCGRSLRVDDLIKLTGQHLPLAAYGKPKFAYTSREW